MFETLLGQLKAEGHDTLRINRKKKVSILLCLVKGEFILVHSPPSNLRTQEYVVLHVSIRQLVVIKLVRANFLLLQTSDKSRHKHCEIICAHSGHGRNRGPAQGEAKARFSRSKKVIKNFAA